MSATKASVPRAETHGYISDMLAQLAELAGEAGSAHLERSLRLLALEAAVGGAGRKPAARKRAPRQH